MHGRVQHDYTIEKDFIKFLASIYGASKDGSRSGVITSNKKEIVKLKDYNDTDSFDIAVDKIQLYNMSFTKMDEALELAQKELFAFSNGARPYIPKILIVIRNSSQAIKHTTDIQITVVDIASVINQRNSLVSYNSTDSFAELIDGDFIEELIENSCTPSDAGM